MRAPPACCSKCPRTSSGSRSASRTSTTCSTTWSRPWLHDHCAVVDVSGTGGFKPVVATPCCWWSESSRARTSAGVLKPRVLRGRPLSSAATASRCVGGVDGEVGALGEVLAEQAVGVLVGAALPGRVRVAEVDRQVGGDGDLGVPGQLDALVPGQRAAQRGGQGGDLGRRWRRGRPRRRGRRAGAPASRTGWCARPGCRSPSRCRSPMIRSPSQWPGTARSSASAGRSVIMTLSLIRSRRPSAGAGAGAAPARCAGRRSAPGAARRGPARTAPGRSSRG